MNLKLYWALIHIKEHQITIDQAVKLDLNTIAKHIAH